MMIDATVAPKVGCISPFGITVCNGNHINAAPQARPEAAAERRLEGVGSRPSLGGACMLRLFLRHLRVSPPRLEQLHWVARRVVENDLCATWPGDNIIRAE